MPFDLLLRGGVVQDGTGAAGRRADVGVLGDRILAVGDLAAADEMDAARVLDVTGLVVAPGFVDAHGHSDGSVLVDGALVSHLRQGFTTQLSGNCGYTLAPLTPEGRPLLQPDLDELGLEPGWRTFPEYLDEVDRARLGPNVAFLVGHGSVRGAVLGPDARIPTNDEVAAMRRIVAEALEAGAFGISTGLIYAPGVHAHPDEVVALVAEVARHGGLYATHMRNESDRLFEALEEAVATAERAGADARRAVRLQVSHLKAGSRAVWGRGAEAAAVVQAACDRGVDAGADQYPYTAAATTLAVVLPPALLALPLDETVAALHDLETRDRIRAEMAHGSTGWENVGDDPGWAGIRISHAPSRPGWAGRSLAVLADELGRDPADLAFDVLAEDRLAVDCVIDCMDEADVAAIAALPWVAVCTDAEGRRPDHPILGRGVPHPRTYGTTARVLGQLVRVARTLPLETAVAKLTSVPAARLGLRDRGTVREGAFADLVVFDPDTVADRASYERPAVHPDGIAHVVVNGALAVLDGEETGTRPGRLLRAS